MKVESMQQRVILDLYMSLLQRTDGRTVLLALQAEGEAHGCPPRSVQKHSHESSKEPGARRETVKRGLRRGC